MDMKKVKSDYRMSQWAKIIKERQESGKKVDEFCKERGLGRNVFYYWQRKLRKAVCTEIVKVDEPAICAPTGWIRLPSTKQVRIPEHPDGDSGNIRTQNRRHPILGQSECLCLSIVNT